MPGANGKSALGRLADALGGGKFAGYAAKGAINAASGLAAAATRSAIEGTSFGDAALASMPDIIAQTLGGGFLEENEGGGWLSRKLGIDKLGGAARDFFGLDGQFGHQGPQGRSFSAQHSLDAIRRVFSSPVEEPGLTPVASFNPPTLSDPAPLEPLPELALLPTPNLPRVVAAAGRRSGGAVSPAAPNDPTLSWSSGSSLPPTINWKLSDPVFGPSFLSRLRAPVTPSPDGYWENLPSPGEVWAAEQRTRQAVHALNMFGSSLGASAVTLSIPFGADLDTQERILAGVGALEAVAGGMVGAPALSRGAAPRTLAANQRPVNQTIAAQAAEGGAVGAAERVAVPNGKFYSVAYETKLDASVWGRSDSVHFNRANAALDDALRSDPAWAAQMEEMIPGVQSSVSKTGGRATPDGWVWHHDVEPGTMQLVPTNQHWDPKFWNTFHPDGRGGYAIWARPAGAPPRK